jgi:hypothetical protein
MYLYTVANAYTNTIFYVGTLAQCYELYPILATSPVGIAVRGLVLMGCFGLRTGGSR